MAPDPEPPSTHGGPNPGDLPDDALLAGYAQSDPATSTAFLTRFQGRVYGLALSMLGDARAAEDVAQEAFLRAWRHASMFDAAAARCSRGSSRSLATPRSTRCGCVGRSPSTSPSWSQRRPAPSPAIRRMSPSSPTTASASAAALARLPESQRRAVVLAGMWGFSASEVADLEQIPLGTAKTRIRDRAPPIARRVRLRHSAAGGCVHVNRAASIEIDAPAATVWDVFSDVMRWPEWTASVKSVVALDGPQLALGARFAIEQPRLPKVVWEVTAVDPGHSWTWRSRSLGTTTGRVARGHPAR